MNIEIKNLCKSFDGQFEIKDLSMEMKSGTFVTFLGPSGCGKTTILRMIAGLEKPDSGEIWFDGDCMFSSARGICVAPEKRRLGYVFQDFALWPHMTVYENVAFPLRASRQTKNLDDKVMEALKAVKLSEYCNRHPGQLSGGQQQRVAFARAIVGRPKCILFDEPLSALDALLREEMRREMKKITTEIGATSIFVTHDQTEAMSMSDYIYVMNHGKVEQYGAPEDVYKLPDTIFVANFIGKSNWLDPQNMFRPEEVSLERKDHFIPYETELIGQNYLGDKYELFLKAGDKTWIIYSEVKQKLGKLMIYINKNNIRNVKEAEIA